MSARSFPAFAVFLLFAPSAFANDPPTKLIVYPAEIALNGSRDEQRLIVIGESADGRKIDLSREAKFIPQDATISRVDAGMIRPLKDGTTNLIVSFGTVQSTVPVKVTDFAKDTLVAFGREIVPILTKSGCNAGSCHGAQHGRGGFRLSLFGFDSLFDHEQIVQSAEGRRVVMSSPESSILLMKPALVMEHGGGEKLKLNGRDYERIRQWLADGAPEPLKDDPIVTKIEVFPTARVLEKGESQQLAVTAFWSDGRREDVTSTAQFDALNDAVAGITPSGLVTAKAQGETHIMIRFAGQANVMQVSLPFAKLAEFPTLAKNNYIDEHLIAKWRELGLLPSPLCSDGEFLRRLYLDVIGTLPKPDEVTAFLTDKSTDKRAKAIDRVLNRPEFIDYWALKWGDLLRINRTVLDEKGMWSFHNWVRGQLRDGVPVDAFVRSIITAEGSTFTDGPANFFRIGQGATDWSETCAQLFLGVRMQCAKCHHHPFEKWSQDDYYGMAAFFVRLGTKNSQEFGLFSRETVIFLRPTGDVSHPRKRTVVKPHPLDGPEMEDEFDRRVKLAAWMTTGENPFFARNIVNRFWGYLMGRGLVEPLDDMRATNPASNPQLLDALAKDFADAKFDMKHLLRTILNSRAYQLSSEVTDENRADAVNVHFTRYSTKRLSAEQLADAIDFATGTQEKYVGLPLGVRAIQLPDPQVRSYLMDTFGRPARQVTCECERTGKPNIAQALHLLNGDFLNRKIADKTGRVELLITKKRTLDESIIELYMSTLSRPPRPEEVAKSQMWVKSAPTEREGLQDLLWVLLNTREFVFNH